MLVWMKPWAMGLLLVACNSRTPSTQPSTPPLEPTASAPVDAPKPSASVAPAGEEAGADAIDRLVRRLAAQPLWTNGVSPQLKLPKTTPVAEVVAQVLLIVSFNPGKVKTHEVISTRSVVIGSEPEPYQAALVDTDQGRKIVLLRYEPPDFGWWSRVFDVPARE